MIYLKGILTTLAMSLPIASSLCYAGTGDAALTLDGMRATCEQIREGSQKESIPMTMQCMNSVVRTETQVYTEALPNGEVTTMNGTAKEGGLSYKGAEAMRRGLQGHKRTCYKHKVYRVSLKGPNEVPTTQCADFSVERAERLCHEIVEQKCLTEKGGVLQVGPGCEKELLEEMNTCLTK